MAACNTLFSSKNIIEQSIVSWTFFTEFKQWYIHIKLWSDPWDLKFKRRRSLGKIEFIISLKYKSQIIFLSDMSHYSVTDTTPPSTRCRWPNSKVISKTNTIKVSTEHSIKISSWFAHQDFPWNIIMLLRSIIYINCMSILSKSLDSWVISELIKF